MGDPGSSRLDFNQNSFKLKLNYDWGFGEKIEAATSEAPTGATPTTPTPPPGAVSAPRPSIAMLTPQQLSQVEDNKIDHRIHEIWFDPSKGNTKAEMMQAYGLTDPSKVHEVKRGERELYKVEFFFLSRPPLPEFEAPPSQLDQAKQSLSLRVAGFSDPAALKKGNLLVKFTSDDTGQQVKDFIVYWVTAKPGGFDVKPIAYRLGSRTMRPKDKSDEKSYVEALQQLLKLNGHLPIKKQASGNPDEQTVLNSFSYQLTNQHLLQPRREETEKLIRELNAKKEKLLQQFLAVDDSKDFDAQVKEQVLLKKQVLSDLARQALETYAQIRTIATGSIEAFKDKKDEAFRAECQKLIDETKNWIMFLLEAIIGIEKKDQARHLYVIDLALAESKLKEAVKAKEGTEVEKREARSKEREAFEKYTRIYEILYSYEKRFANFPGVPERCKELRQDILRRLAEKGKELEKENKDRALRIVNETKDRLAEVDKKYSKEEVYLEERTEALFEEGPKLLGGGEKEGKGEVSEAEIKRQTGETTRVHNKASFILRNILKGHPAQSLIIEFFSMLLKSEDKVSLGALFGKFDALMKIFSPEDLNALGKYLFYRELYAAQGKPESEIKSLTSSLFYRAKKVIDKIEKLCKAKDDKIESRVESSNLQNALHAFFRVFYRLQFVHNTWAKANKQPEISLAEINRLGKQITEALPETGLGRKVFSILRGIPEDPQLAAIELSRKLQTEVIRIQEKQLFKIPLEAARFDKKAQLMVMDPRTLGKMSVDAGRGMQPVHSHEIREFLKPLPSDSPQQKAFKDLSLKNLPAEEGYYLMVEGKDAAGKPALVFQKAPATTHFALPESQYSGTTYSYDITDFLQNCGAALIGLAFDGRVDTTGPLRRRLQGIQTNALNYNGIDGLITAARRGDYEVKGLTLRKAEQTAFKSALEYLENNNYKGSDLSAADIKLARRLFERGNTFKENEIPALKALMLKLEKLNPEKLTREKRLFFKKAVAEIKRAVTNRLERKDGLDENEVATLTQLSQYMKEHKIMITDGRFIHLEPSEEMLKQIPLAEQDKFKDCYRKSILIFRKIHFEMMGLAGQHAPEIKIPGNLMKWYTTFWHEVWKAAKESISPPRMQMFQLASMPPIEMFNLKAYIHPEKVSVAMNAVQTIEILKLAQEKGKEALKGLDGKKLEELRKLFNVQEDSELEKIFEYVKSTPDFIRDFRQRVGRASLKAEAFPSFGTKKDQIWKGLMKAGYIDKDGKLQPKCYEKRESFKLEGVALSADEANKILDILQQIQEDGKPSLRALKGILREQVIKPLRKKFEGARKEQEGISKKFENENYNPDTEERVRTTDTFKEAGKAGGKRGGRIENLTEIERALALLSEVEESTEDDPVKLLYNLSQVEDSLATLQRDEAGGLFEVGEKPEEKKLLSDIRLKINELRGAAKKALDSREAYLKWVEAKQEVEIKKQENMDYLNSDKFTYDDFKELKKRLPQLFEDKTFAEMAVTWLGKILVQQDGKIYGLFGRDTGLTPLQALEQFFKNGGEISLSKLTPEVGESMERYYAKLAMGKLFEKLPQAGKFNAAMPVLMTLFGGHGGMASVFNPTRDAAVFFRGNWDEVSYGAESFAGKAAILRDPHERLKYYFLYMLASSSNTISPKSNMASQFHYIMIYSPVGQRYLERKLKEAQALGGDISVAMSTVTSKVTQQDLKDLIEYIKEKVIPQIQQNPRLARQIQYLIDKNYVGSELFKTVVADAIRDMEKGTSETASANYTKKLEELFKKLNPGDQVKEFELYNSLREQPAQGVAQVLEDMFMLTPELDKSKRAEDFKKQSLGSLDVVGLLVETRVPYQDMQDAAESVKVLQVDAQGKPGEISDGTWGRDAKAIKEWFEIYAPKIGDDFVKTFSTKKGINKFLNGVLQELGKTVDYGWGMTRRIGMGLSELYGGIRDFINAKDAAGRKKALAKIREGLAKTGGNFATIEGAPFTMIYLGIKEKLEKGDIGGAVADGIITTLMFGAGLKATKEIGKWVYKGSKNVVWDNLIMRRNIQPEFLRPNTYVQRFYGGIGATILRYGSVGIPIAQHTYYEVQSQRAGLGSYHLNQIRNRVGTLQVSIVPGNAGVEIFAGEQTSATIANRWRVPFKYLNYGTRVANITGPTTSELWSGVKGVASSAVALPFREGLGIYRAARGEIGQPMGHEEALVEQLQRIKANPDGYTTLEITRVSPEFLERVLLREGDLQSEIKMLEEEVRQARSQNRGEEYQEGIKELGKKQAQLEYVRQQLKKNQTQVKIKNSEFIELVKSGGGAKAVWRYLTGKFGKGSYVELRAQFKQLAKVYIDNKPAIDSATADRVQLPMSNGVEIMREIAKPNPKTTGATKLYEIKVGGRPVYLMGNQVAKIVWAHLNGEDLGFVRSFGLNEAEAAAIGQEIQAQFGENFNELNRLVKAGKSWKVTLEPIEIPLSALSGKGELTTVRSGRVLSPQNLVEISPDVRALLGGRRLAYLLVEHDISHPDKAAGLPVPDVKIKLDPQLLMNSEGTGQILYVDRQGSARLISIEERFAQEGIRLNNAKGTLDKIAIEEPAAFERFIRHLKNKRVTSLTLPEVDRYLNKNDLIQIENRIPKVEIPQAVAVTELAAEGPAVRVEQRQRALSGEVQPTPKPAVENAPKPVDIEAVLREAKVKFTLNGVTSMPDSIKQKLIDLVRANAIKEIRIDPGISEAELDRLYKLASDPALENNPEAKQVREFLRGQKALEWGVMRIKKLENGKAEIVDFRDSERGYIPGRKNVARVIVDLGQPEAAPAKPKLTVLQGGKAEASPPVKQIMEKYKISQTEAEKIHKEAKAVREKGQAAKKEALGRIDDLEKRKVISHEHAEKMRKRSAKNWDRTLAQVEDAVFKKARILELRQRAETLRTEIKELRASGANKTIHQRLAIEAKTKQLAEIRNILRQRSQSFIRTHAPIFGVMLAMNLVKHWDEMKKGNYQGFASEGVVSIAIFGLSIAGEKTLGLISKGSAARLTGGIITAASAALEHKGRLSTGHGTTQLVALADILKNFAFGALAAEVGVAVTTGTGSAILGFAAGLATFLAVDVAGDALGYKEWLEKKMSRGDIVKSMQMINLRLSTFEIEVKNDTTDTPFFEKNIVDVSGNKVLRVSQAQQTLAVIKSVEKYTRMSAQEKEALRRANPQQARELESIAHALEYIKKLKIENYADLDIEALKHIAKAVSRFRRENGEAYTHLEVKLQKNKIGSRVVYDVNVSGVKWQIGTNMKYAVRDSYQESHYLSTINSQPIEENEKALRKTAATFDAAIDRVVIQTKSELVPETPALIAAAVRRFRQQHPDTQNAARSKYLPNLIVELSERSENIYHPLTGEVTGIRTVYDIKVSGAGYIQSFNGWAQSGVYEETYPTQAKESIVNPQKFRETGALLAAKSGPDRYDLTLQDLIENNMAIPFDKLDQFPVIKRQLEEYLSLQGYDLPSSHGQVKREDLERVLAQFSNHQGQAPGRALTPDVIKPLLGQGEVPA